MIPKVLLYGSRAAWHVQQATNNGFRNVLQLQTAPVVGPSASSSGSILNIPGAASSSWGAGGSQYYTYQGYTGAGRAITQANSSTSNDTGRDQSDDAEERPVIRLRTLGRPFPARDVRVPTRRPRSNSLSLGSGHIERGRDLGVLQVVQRHARFNHVFSPSPSAVRTAIAELHSSPSSPSGTHSPSAAHTLPIEQNDGDVALARLKGARAIGDRAQVLSLIEEYSLRREDRVNWLGTKPAAIYNTALDALVHMRRPGEHLTTILEVHNAMLAQSLIPNDDMYRQLLSVMLDRDAEVQDSLEYVNRRLWRGELGIEMDAKSLLEARLRLEAEKNYESAIALFEAGVTFRNTVFPRRLHLRLLQACAKRADVEIALGIFSRYEHRFGPASVKIYTSLLEVYRSAGDLEGATEIFNDFSTKAAKAQSRAKRAPLEKSLHDEMISTYIECGQSDKALELLEIMMDQGQIDGYPPPPTVATYRVIIESFCKSGDVESALRWYHRLNRQSPNEEVEHSVPSWRTEYSTWRAIFDALISRSQLDELNKFVGSIAGSDHLWINFGDLHLWLDLNCIHLFKSDRAAQQEQLRSLARVFTLIVTPRSLENFTSAFRRTVMELIHLAIKTDLPAEALSLFRPLVLSRFSETEGEGYDRMPGEARIPFHRAWFLNLCRGILEVCSSDEVHHASVLRVALDICKLAREIDASDAGAGVILSEYYVPGSEPSTTNDAEDWNILANAFCDAELRACEQSPPQVSSKFESFINDIARFNNLKVLSSIPIQRIVQVLSKSRGEDAAAVILRPLGHSALQYIRTSLPRDTSPSEQSAISEYDSVSASSLPSLTSISGSSATTVQIDAAHSQFVDEHSIGVIGRQLENPSPLICFERFQDGARRSVYPFPHVLGRLITALGRLGELDKVQRVYAASQVVLSSLELEKQTQTVGWFLIEDQMISALSHAGHPDTANVHRARIIQHGGAPSADSYGALIAATKDTTDDSSLAQELFEESIRLNVLPNTYLYNTVISKLAKARKTEYALELFHRMPYLGMRPSTVTYAAVIGACCRVGDGESAIFLFDEMVGHPRYRPRVPVYNSMIQFFVTHNKDREGALRYYRMLMDSGLQPSAHTYKLLLDVYGSIEPVDVASLESTFHDALSRSYVQGPHWAAMINAWGCVVKDLDRAMEIFESIKAKDQALPDAVVYEAFFNALFTAKRLDLVSRYLERMRESGVHMTAYIANVLIKGYTSVGEIEQARATFDSLVDPPIGVAAPHNHLTPSDSSTSAVPPDAPVYREPSSWEAMIKSELDFGDRDRAHALMSRLDARMFPLAVTSRIRAFFNETVSPQSLSPSTTSIST